MPDVGANGTAESGGVQVITRAAAILGALAESRGGSTIVQLSDHTGLPKSTVHRICRALEQVGYVHIDETTGRRELGPGLLRLAVIGRRDLRVVIEPYLAGISDALNETVDLAVLDGSDVLFVAQHPAPRRELMAIARVGVHFPAYSMASGKVLLALLPDEDVRARLPRKLVDRPSMGDRGLEQEVLQGAGGGPRSPDSATSARSCGAASVPSPSPSPTRTVGPSLSPCRCRRCGSRRVTRRSPPPCWTCGTRSRADCGDTPLREGRHVSRNARVHARPSRPA